MGIAAAGGPGAQWDALPTSAKLQIIGFIGFLEMYSETSYVLGLCGEKHYVKGGKPGFFPPLKAVDWPHPVPLNLWDPFGFTAKMTPERKAKALNAEINNGRLAMIGLFGMLSASKGLIVPGLDSWAPRPTRESTCRPSPLPTARCPLSPRCPRGLRPTRGTWRRTRGTRARSATARAHSSRPERGGRPVIKSGGVGVML